MYSGDAEEFASDDWSDSKKAGGQGSVWSYEVNVSIAQCSFTVSAQCEVV